MEGMTAKERKERAEEEKRKEAEKREKSLSIALETRNKAVLLEEKALTIKQHHRDKEEIQDQLRGEIERLNRYISKGTSNINDITDENVESIEKIQKNVSDLSRNINMILYDEGTIEYYK